MPTRGREGEDAGHPEGTSPHPPHVRDVDHPGYETQDVNVGGIVTFLGGLTGFIIVFFVFCWVMGKGINYVFYKQDGAPTRNAMDLTQAGAATHGQKVENLAANADVEQKQLAQVARAFPTPILESDDGFQNTAELHAREDLLLNYYSTSADLPNGTIRIPIEQAMNLVVQRGLGTSAPAAQAEKPMMGEREYAVTAPLTNGFARTGYELEVMEARAQKLEMSKPEKAEK